jgi:glutaredoxin 3
MPTIVELKLIAKGLNIKKYYAMNKSSLSRAISKKRSKKRSRTRSKKRSRTRNPPKKTSSRKKTSHTNYKPCKPYQYRHPVTKRCRNKTGSVAVVNTDTNYNYKPCKPYQYRHPVTKRCRNKTGSVAVVQPTEVVNTDTFTIYTKKTCNYCILAKGLLTVHKIKYNEIEVDTNNKSMVHNYTDPLTNSYRTFPMIFHNLQFIGGYTDLVKFLKKKKESLYIPIAKQTETTNYIAFPIQSLIQLLYLSYKYHKDCVLIPIRVNLKKNFRKIYDFKDIMLIYSEKLNIISIPSNFFSTLRNCVKDKTKRFILIPFGFNCYKSGHANMIIYDKKFKSMERFEPHGERTGQCNPPDLDKRILSIFRKYMGYDFIKDYYKPLQFCPKISFQTLQSRENQKKPGDPAGFCSAWTVWYSEIRLANPDIDRNELVKRSLDYLRKNPRSLTTYIRNYAHFMYTMKAEMEKGTSKADVFISYAKHFEG